MGYIICAMRANIKKIMDILSRAECDLRELIVVAAKEGDYLGIDSAREVAVSIKDLLGQISEQETLPKKNKENHKKYKKKTKI